jgi:hypothetical protein
LGKVISPLKRTFASGRSRVLVMSDKQAPFDHRDAVDFLDSVNRKYKCTQVVDIGDEIDFHAMSDYDHDPDGLSPGDELRASIKAMKPYYDLFPKVKVCISNHTSRPFRQAYKHGFPEALLRPYRDFLQAPKGWSWGDEWEIDGVRYEHGDGIAGGARAAAYNAPLKNMQSTVFGHFHSYAGVQFLANPQVLLFGMNVGCLIDVDAYAFKYGKKTKEKPILGCGVVLGGLPLFVPMVLSRRGRWIGRLQ